MTERRRVALVTGGARRLGRHLAIGLARAGWDTAISYHAGGAAAAATVAEIKALGRRACAVSGDVRQRAEVHRLVDEVTASLAPIDLLVVNAGIFHRTPLAEVSESDWAQHFDTNLTGAFWCAQRVGLDMRQRGGAIIMIADVAGLTPWPNYLPYSVSKAAIIALTRGLAIELAPRVRVNAIAPGPVLLPDGMDAAAIQSAVARTLLRRAGEPGDVVEAAVYLADAPYVTGVVLPVDGGRHLG